MIITVCVGSSCHIKGSRNIINNFNDLLKKANLGNKVELKGSFCMERCGEGINWQIDDEFISSQTLDDALDVFKNRVLDKVSKE